MSDRDSMEHVSAPLGRALADVFSRVQPYTATGRRILNRSGETPRWMDLDEAEREAFRLTAELVRADDPGLVLPRINSLAWAILDARAPDNDPTPAALGRAA